MCATEHAIDPCTQGTYIPSRVCLLVWALLTLYHKDAAVKGPDDVIHLCYGKGPVTVQMM